MTRNVGRKLRRFIYYKLRGTHGLRILRSIRISGTQFYPGSGYTWVSSKRTDSMASWRDDKSFLGLDSQHNGGGNGGREIRKRGEGPQFTRVIPKFLQSFHKPETLDHEASLALKRPPAQVEDDDDEEEELDDVQKEAILAYEEAQKEKMEKIQKEESEAKQVKEKRKPTMVFSTSKKESNKTKAPSASHASKESDSKPKKKSKTLNNQKLLSFSMDD
jgi:hypothetical protein